jgi:preprotein translocase subunit YajC
MKIVLKIGLLAGLLMAMLALFSGCLVPTATSTATDGAETSFWSQWGMIIFLVLMVAVFYFLMIRPQQRRSKEQRQMMSNLQKGDRVITAGGIYGTIDSLSEDSAVIKVEGGGTLRVARGSLAVRREDMK